MRYFTLKILFFQKPLVRIFHVLKYGILIKILKDKINITEGTK